MNVRWFNDPDTIATTDHDGPGRCVVTWEGEGDQGVQCYGWIEGDRLFLPSDGDGKRAWDFDEQTGLPDRCANWYDCETGRDAIIGVPGSFLSIFA